MNKANDSKSVLVSNPGHWTIRDGEGRVATTFARTGIEAMMKGFALWTDAREIRAEKVDS